MTSRRRMATAGWLIMAAMALSAITPGTALSLPANAALGVVAKPKPEVSASAVSRAAGIPAAEVLSMPHGLVAIGSDGDATSQQQAAGLMATGQFEYVSPNYVRQPAAYTPSPSDPLFRDASAWASDGIAYYSYGKSWGLRPGGGSDFSAVWPYLVPDGGTVAYHARTADGETRVAVIDTGFYMNHPDKGSMIVAGKDEFESYTDAGGFVTDYDVTPPPATPTSVEGFRAHGTCVAGQVSAAFDNGVGVPGAAPGTKVLVYKVAGTINDSSFSSYGYPQGSVAMLDGAIIRGIYDATDAGADVISMSLGGPGYSTAMAAACKYARDNGVIVVAATGNDGKNGTYYPANISGVVGVGSYSLATPGGAIGVASVPVRSAFSNYGTGTDILAPGHMVFGLTSASAGYYQWWDGTSMATPYVAAAAANVRRLVPGLSPAEVEGVLFSSARSMGAAGYDTETGWGALSMGAAAALLRESYPVLSAPSPSVPAGTDEDGTVSVSWPAVPGYRVSYDVSLDGGAPVAGSAASRTLSGLSDGTHRVSVRARSPRNWSTAASVGSVSFSVDIPPTAPSAVSYTGGTVAWSDSEGSSSHSHQVSVDGTGSPATVMGTDSWSAAGVPLGRHTAYVRTTGSSGRTSPWASVSFTRASTTPTLSIARSAAAVKHGAAVTLSGILSAAGTGLPGRTVSVSSTTDGGKSWSLAGSAVTASGGKWSLAHKPGRNRAYRASFAGDPDDAPAASGSVAVGQQAYLSKPGTTYSQSFGRAYGTASYLKPRHTSGGYPVAMKYYRYESGKWKIKKTVMAKASNYSSYSKVYSSYRAVGKGSWRAYAYYAGGMTYSATSSGYAYFAVR